MFAADSQLPTHGTTGKMGDQVPRGECPYASAKSSHKASHHCAGTGNACSVHANLADKAKLPAEVCHVSAHALLLSAVGSYTENRSLMQGAAQSTGGADGDDEPNKKYWFLNIKRYRRFFNVDTEVPILHRVYVSANVVHVAQGTFVQLHLACTTTHCCMPVANAGHPHQSQRLCHRFIQGRLL